MGCGGSKQNTNDIANPQLKPTKQVHTQPQPVAQPQQAPKNVVGTTNNSTKFLQQSNQTNVKQEEIAVKEEQKQDIQPKLQSDTRKDSQGQSTQMKEESYVKKEQKAQVNEEQKLTIQEEQKPTLKEEPLEIPPQVAEEQSSDDEDLEDMIQELLEDEQIQYDADLERELSGKKKSRKGQLISLYEREFPMLETETTEEPMIIGDIKMLISPTNPPVLSQDPPLVQVTLDHAYGFRCFDTRQNLFYCNNGQDIVFNTAALGVVQNLNTNKQSFLGGKEEKLKYAHDNDVTALCINVERNLVATGQAGLNPKVCIWKTDEIELLQKFRIGQDRVAVSAISLSYDSKFLVVLDMHENKHVSVWDWEQAHKLADFQTDAAKLLDVDWSLNQHQFSTVGIGHIFFWNYTDKTLSKTQGKFGSKGKICNMTCVNWLPNDNCVTGGTNGQLYLWKNSILQRSVKVHQNNEAVHSLIVVNGEILSGGNDHCVYILDFDLKIKQSLNVGTCPRSLDIWQQNILVGGRNGSINQWDIYLNQSKSLVDSHYDGEVWGLAFSQSNPSLIYSSGDDNTIRIWDLKNKQCIKTSVIDQERGQDLNSPGGSNVAMTSDNQQSRALSINDQFGHLAVAKNNGHISIRNLNDIDQILFNLTDSDKWSECLQYQPQGQKLAVGCHDSIIYLYDCGNSYQLISQLKGHTSFISALDWSQCGNFVQSTSGEHEIIFWDIQILQILPEGGAQLRDEKWATWTCKFGWPIIGVQYPGITDLAFVNGVFGSPDRSLVAVGNDWGTLDIFRFPNGEGAKSLSYRAHSQSLTTVIWTEDFIVTAGGFDQTIMQWKYSIDSKSVLEQIGGFAALQQYIDDLFIKLLQSEENRQLYSEVDLTEIKTSLAMIIAQNLDSTHSYIGRPIEQVFKSSPLSSAHFDDIVSNLKQILEDQQIASSNISQIVSAVQNTKQLIPNQGETLLQQMGGSEKLAEFFEKLYDRLVTDPILSSQFDGYNTQKIKQNQSKFFIKIMTLPDYQDKNYMENVHLGMQITNEQLDQFINHSKEILNELQISQDPQNQIIASIEFYRSSITSQLNFRNKKMSSLYSWSIPISVPPVHDTTPCMDYMLQYEDCILDAVPRQMEVVHPNWPTMWPKMLTDGRLRPDLMNNDNLFKGPMNAQAYKWDKPLPESVKEKLWECEEERYIYKACLRKVIGLKNDPRTRYPIWQPEENYHRSLGRRLTVHENNRYPTDLEHSANEDLVDETTWMWRKFIEEEGDI